MDLLAAQRNAIIQQAIASAHDRRSQEARSPFALPVDADENVMAVKPDVAWERLDIPFQGLEDLEA